MHFLLLQTYETALLLREATWAFVQQGIYLEISDISASLCDPSLVQLQFIYERDKYLLKEILWEMGLKVMVEVTQTD